MATITAPTALARKKDIHPGCDGRDGVLFQPVPHVYQRVIPARNGEVEQLDDFDGKGDGVVFPDLVNVFNDDDEPRHTCTCSCKPLRCIPELSDSRNEAVCYCARFRQDGKSEPSHLHSFDRSTMFCCDGLVYQRVQWQLDSQCEAGRFRCVGIRESAYLLLFRLSDPAQAGFF